MAKRHQVQTPPVPQELTTLAKSTLFKDVKWLPQAGAPAFSALTASGTLAARGTNLGHREADKQLPREAPLKKRTEIQPGTRRVSEHSEHLVAPLPFSPGVQFTGALSKEQRLFREIHFFCLWGCSQASFKNRT